MKLIIQIPCYNEEQVLADTLAELPRELPGVDQVEWLVIDDGSVDQTVAVARANGVDHIVSLGRNKGLAKAFAAGIEAAIARGADLIVNTDADNQYRAADIPKLVAPILAGEADLVVGCRPIEEIAHFSRIKKILQRLGSWAVRIASGTQVADAASGFRAFSREAALRLNVYSEYTYTMDTIIQPGLTGMKVLSVPIRTNAQTRESRLVKSVMNYVRRNGLAIVRVFLIYRPARIFFFAGLVPFTGGVVLCLRWLVLYFGDIAAGEVARGRAPSLILAAILIIVAIQMWLFGLLADLLAANRKLIEDTQYRLRLLTWAGDQPPPESAER